MGQALADARQLAKPVHTVVLDDLRDGSVQPAQSLCRVPIRLNAVRVRTLFIEELRHLLELRRDLKINFVRHDDSSHAFPRVVSPSSSLVPLWLPRSEDPSWRRECIGIQAFSRTEMA